MQKYIIAIFVSLLTLLASCQNSAQTYSSDTIHTAIGNRVTNYYLKTSLQKNTWNFNLLFAQTLFLKASDGSLVGDLAESVNFEKRGGYVVTLRHGAKFHNQQGVSCEDVLWSFNDSNHEGSPYESTFSNLYEFKCEDNKFLFKFKKPTHALIERLLTGIRIYPKNLYPKHSSSPIGSGPYKFESSDETKTVWVKHDQYLGALKASAKRLIIHHISDSRMRFEYLKNKKLDLLVDWSPELNPLLKSEAFEIFEIPSTSMATIGFQSNSRCFNNIKNRELVAKIICEHIHKNSFFIQNKYIKLTHEKCDSLKIDTSPTKLANFKNTCAKTKLYFSHSMNFNHYLSEVISKLKTSLNIETSAMESSVYFSKLSNGDLDLFGSMLPTENDASRFFEYLHSSQTPPQKNRFHYKSSQTDSITEKLLVESDKSVTEKLLISLNDQLMKDLPLIPLGHTKDKVIHSQNLMLRKSIFDHPWLMMIEAVKKKHEP